MIFLYTISPSVGLLESPLMFTCTALQSTIICFVSNFHFTSLGPACSYLNQQSGGLELVGIDSALLTYLQTVSSSS